MPVQTVIKLRRSTAAQWTSANPILAAGEPGLETDTGLIKYGDGATAWVDLLYGVSGGIETQVHNATGSSIPKGSVVYISGANGSNPLISLADADTEATSSKTVGITTETIANGGQGKVIESGLLTGVNTGSATVGQSVWLSSTAGSYVFNAPPAKPAHSVYLGVVTRAHAINGAILVKVQNGYELDELHDVNIGTKADNNLLAWDSVTSMWTNQTASQAGVAAAAHTHEQSDIVNLSTSLAGKAAVNHTHSADQITTTSQVKSANYTLVASDAQSFIRCDTGGGAFTITVPNVLQSGQRIDFIQNGANKVTFAGSGIVINSVDSKLKTNKLYSAATIFNAGGTYFLVGDLSA